MLYVRLGDGSSQYYVVLMSVLYIYIYIYCVCGYHIKSFGKDFINSRGSFA